MLADIVGINGPDLPLTIDLEISDDFPCGTIGKVIAVVVVGD